MLFAALVHILAALPAAFGQSFPTECNPVCNPPSDYLFGCAMMPNSTAGLECMQAICKVDGLVACIDCSVNITGSAEGPYWSLFGCTKPTPTPTPTPSPTTSDPPAGTTSSCGKPPKPSKSRKPKPTKSRQPHGDDSDSDSDSDEE